MFFKLTKVSAFHRGVKLYETLSFFNFFAGGAIIGAFRYGASRRNMPPQPLRSRLICPSLVRVARLGAITKPDRARLIVEGK